MPKALLSLPKKILKIRKRFLIPGAIILLLLILSIARRGSSQKPLLYADVKRENLKQEVSASGTITGKNSADLHFKSGGKLGYINVKLGDTVSEGQVIAGLDTQDLSINLQQAENNLRNTQATVDKTLDDIHLTQYGNGGFSNVGTANETEAQREARTSAETARDNAADSVKAAQRAFEDAVITSPITGIITSQNPVAGEVVGPTDTIAQVVDFSQPVFDADVDESDIGSIKVGQRAEFTLNAYGDRTFNGTVLEITPATHTDSSGSTVVTVKISADDPSIKPIAGLGGQVNIITDERNNVLAIPNDAIKEDNTVFVKTSSGLINKKVKVLFQTDSDSEIEGLNANDQIVTNPSAVPTQKSNPLQKLFRRG